MAQEDHLLSRITMDKELIPVQINSRKVVLQPKMALEIHMCQATMGQPISIRMHSVPHTAPAMVIITIIRILIRIPSTIHSQLNNTTDLDHHLYHSRQTQLNSINIWIHCNNNITSEFDFAIYWSHLCCDFFWGAFFSILYDFSSNDSKRLMKY